MRREARGARRKMTRMDDNRVVNQGVEAPWTPVTIETFLCGRGPVHSPSRFVETQDSTRFDGSGVFATKCGVRLSAFRATLRKEMSAGPIEIARVSSTSPRDLWPSFPLRQTSRAQSGFSKIMSANNGSANVTSWAACSPPSSVHVCAPDRAGTSRASRLVPRAYG
jgi:hypothetical protein